VYFSTIVTTDYNVNWLNKLINKHLLVVIAILNPGIRDWEICNPGIPFRD